MNLKTAHFSILTTTALRSSKFSGRSAVFMVFVWCDVGLTKVVTMATVRENGNSSCRYESCRTDRQAAVLIIAFARCQHHAVKHGAVLGNTCNIILNNKMLVKYLCCMSVKLGM